MAPSVAPRLPMYPPGAPGLGQQFLYGQGPPAIIPQQVIFFLSFSILHFSNDFNGGYYFHKVDCCDKNIYRNTCAIFFINYRT